MRLPWMIRDWNLISLLPMDENTPGYGCVWLWDARSAPFVSSAGGNVKLSGLIIAQRLFWPSFTYSCLQRSESLEIQSPRFKENFDLFTFLLKESSQLCLFIYFMWSHKCLVIKVYVEKAAASDARFRLWNSWRSSVENSRENVDIMTKELLILWSYT